jgi:general secretion pathway protein I
MSRLRLYKRYGCPSTAGFTLLEVMVAVAVVAIALVVLLRLHLMSLDNTLRAQDLTTAVLLAQGKIATMNAFPETGEEQGKFEGPELERFSWFTRVTEQTFPASEAGQRDIEVRHILVTVVWFEGHHEQQYTLEAYGAK